MTASQPRIPTSAPVVSMGWDNIRNPYDIRSLWSPPYLLTRGVRNDAGRRAFGIESFIAGNPLPIRGDRRRQPVFASVLLEMHRSHIEEDQRFNAGEALTQLLQDGERLHWERFGESVWPRGQAARFALRAHDGPSDRIVVRIGRGLAFPNPAEEPEGVLHAVFVEPDGRETDLELQPWLCLRADGAGPRLATRQPAIYRDNQRLLLGFSPEEGGVVMAGAPVPARGSVFVDLDEARPLMMAGGTHLIEQAVDGGTVRLRLERSAAAPRPPAAETVRAVATGPTRAAPTQASPAQASSAQAAPAQAAEPRRPRRQPEVPARQEPFLDPPPGTAPPPVGARTADREADAPTIVQPIPASGDDDGFGHKTIVLEPDRTPETPVARLPGPSIGLTRLGFLRVDGPMRDPQVRGYELKLNASGMPCMSHGGAPALILSADNRHDHLLARGPQDEKAQPLAPEHYDDLPLFEPAPPMFRDYYHGFWTLPEMVVRPLVEGRRHRLGRSAGSWDKNGADKNGADKNGAGRDGGMFDSGTMVPDPAPKLSFAMLEAPGSLTHATDLEATLEDLGLSREHLILVPLDGQLHIAQARGQTPVWKLGADGRVDCLPPESTDELILTVGDSFLVAGYLVEFLER